MAEAGSEAGKDGIVIKKMHIDQAFADLFASPALKALKSLCLHQRLFVASIFRQVRILGCALVEFDQVLYVLLRLYLSITICAADKALRNLMFRSSL